jgi:uncharacterized membrane protein YidH (DUF202 family)
MINPSETSVLGQPWLLSVVSGLIAVLLYRFLLVNKQQQQQQEQQQHTNSKVYIGVFLTVAVLVYGSFVVSMNSNVCKLMNNNIPIQTGGAAPF